MREIKLGKHTVKVFDSIEDLPVTRFHKYQKMLLIDSGMGADMAAVDAHLAKARRFVAMGDSKNATAELDNLRMNIFMIIQEMSPKHLAFASLVFAVDGVECSDISDDALKRTAALFADVPVKIVSSVLADVKKKIDGELLVYFPQRYDDGAAKEFYEIILKRTRLVLKELSEGRNPDEEPEVGKLENQIATFFKPQCFAGKDSSEIMFDKQFENVCLMISENIQKDAKQMTVLEYQNAFEYIQERAKKNEQKRGKFKR